MNPFWRLLEIQLAALARDAAERDALEIVRRLKREFTKRATQ